MENLEDMKRVYNAVKIEYDRLNALCKMIQDSYNGCSNEPLELGHEDILPLLNVLDSFDGEDLYGNDEYYEEN